MLLHSRGGAFRRPTPRARPSAARARLPRAKLGPESTTVAAASVGLLVDHLRHPPQRVGLEPLRRADDDGAGFEVRQRRANDGAQAVRRHRHDDEAARPSSAVARLAVGEIASASGTSGKIAPLTLDAPELLDERGVARPQPDAVPARARWTASAVPQLPAPRTAVVFMRRTPMRRSVPARRRRQLLR